MIAWIQKDSVGTMGAMPNTSCWGDLSSKSKLQIEISPSCSGEVSVAGLVTSENSQRSPGAVAKARTLKSSHS
jgi:hypothetical protein